MPVAVLYNRVANTVLHHRLLAYFIVSLASVSAVIVNSLRNYSNFYAVSISLSKSSRSVLALANFAFLIALCIGHLIQRIFFGSLRANEVERLYDRLWFFVTESLLAFTIFRDEFDFPFAMMFGFLLFVKSFHWLAGDRIEWMDQRPYPGPPLSFHIRMLSLFSLLWCTDLVMFLFAVESTLTNGVGGMVLFASEYGILMASILNTISKYLLSTYELRRAGRRGGENAPPWENKSMWTFYIELVTDFLKLTTYLAFFTIIITFYGVPLNIIRDVYITARSFITRLRALHRYQTATRNMDQRYPNATPEELAAMSDHTCIICREEMALAEAPTQGQAQTPANDGPNMTPKKLPCGHIFHFHCLRSWLERQQSCPTCRRTVLDNQPANGNPAPAPAPQAPVPQPQNGVQPAAQHQNQAGNNLLGNPLGYVGRLLGAPQPANQPAQAVNNGRDRPARPTTEQAFHEVVIRYHIPAGGVQPPPEQERVLRAPPAYQGFVGPNGAWQPWPTGHDQNAQPQPSSSEATVSPAGSNGPTAPSEEQSTITDPREAAARAALTRFSSGTRPEKMPVASEARPSSSARFDDSTRPSSTPNDIPSLIPLYAFNGANGLPTVPVSATRATHGGASISNSNDFQSPTTSAKSFDRLAEMDRVTREAIDERLRVLERVSNTLYTCIDELTQMRSTLTELPTSAETHTGPTDAGPSHTQDKGKQHAYEDTHEGA